MEIEGGAGGKINNRGPVVPIFLIAVVRGNRRKVNNRSTVVLKDLF